jgi:hypothetical protein
MAWHDPTEQDAKVNVGAEYDPIFRARERPLPMPLEIESPTAYRRRLAETVQKELAPNCRDFDIRQSTGTAFDVLERQIRADALREALHPTNVPDGELRQVTRRDAAGRPYYEFYGSPRAWLDQFAAPIKRLVGIRQSTDHSFRPGNLG